MYKDGYITILLMVLSSGTDSGWRSSSQGVDAEGPSFPRFLSLAGPVFC